MSDEISDERVAELLALEERATVSPWWVERVPEWQAREDGFRPWLLKYRWDDVPTWIAESSNRKYAEGDFKLIAALRNDARALLLALRAARQRAREAEAKLREPRWYFDDGESVDPDDKAAELPPGSAFRLDGARPTGTHYFRADALGSNEITEAEYTAALAAAESAAATGGGT